MNARFLNLACGATRPQSHDDIEWTNLDQLHDVLLPGTPERANLDAEPNYVNHDITKPLPFTDETFVAVLFSHGLEHFDCMQGLFILYEAHRVLVTGGMLYVSVPDVSVMRKHWRDDKPQHAVELFGEPIHLPDGATTFHDYAIWNRHHRTIFTEDVLWSYFVRLGIHPNWISGIRQFDDGDTGPYGTEIHRLLNRRKFSIEMCVIKG